jgi:DNA-binding transcriptional MerR regulator
MRISELARRTNTSTRSLRHYEHQGLLKPLRLDNGYREYTVEAVETVQRIRWLLSAGLTTNTIRDVLPCVLEEKPKEIRCLSLRRKLEREVERIEAQVSDLKHSASLLRGVLHAERRSADQP